MGSAAVVEYLIGGGTIYPFSARSLPHGEDPGPRTPRPVLWCQRPLVDRPAAACQKFPESDAQITLVIGRGKGVRPGRYSYSTRLEEVASCFASPRIHARRVRMIAFQAIVLTTMLTTGSCPPFRRAGLASRICDPRAGIASPRGEAARPGPAQSGHAGGTFLRHARTPGARRSEPSHIGRPGLRRSLGQDRALSTNLPRRARPDPRNRRHCRQGLEGSDAGGHPRRGLRQPCVPMQGPLWGATVFEVDLPPMQALKKLRVCEVLGRAPDNVVFVPVDLATGPGPGPTERGLSPGPQYRVRAGGGLDVPRRARRGHDLALRGGDSAPGSTIVFDYMSEPPGEAITTTNC